MKPQDLVAAGYDEIADQLAEWRPGITESPDDAWLDALFARLPKLADVLEPGCGHGQAARPLVVGHMPRADLPAAAAANRRLAAARRMFLRDLRPIWVGRRPRRFLGVPMFFGSYTDEETLDLLVRTGFEIEREEVVTIVEPEVGEGSFLWVLATRGRNARYLGPPR